MPKKREYSREAIDKALAYVRNKEGSVRQAGKLFGVPRSSIQFKLLHPETKFKSGPDPVLTEEEEKSICDLIITLSKRGFPLKKEDIQENVQHFLKMNPRPNPFRDGKPGEAWFKAFLKRWPIIAVRTSEGVTNASACVSEQNIRKWFQEIADYIDKQELSEVIADPTRVFNADETGFNICPKTGKVLAEKGSKNVYQIEKGSAKENITAMFTFSASGSVIKPMIIYPYKRIPEKVALSVPTGWGIGRSDSGWMTAAIFHDFIENVFYPGLVENSISLPVILFVDGHKTHITIEVAELCRRLKIHLIALYPNATRILQPADVAAFRPLKGGWKKSLREWYAENNYQMSLTKETFAPLLKTVLDSIIKKDTLINGFRVTGLYPFDANNVDYSKCIPTEKENKRSEVDIEDARINHLLDFKCFAEIIGPSIIQQCESDNNTTQRNCEHFQAIHAIWKKFKKTDGSYDICSQAIVADEFRELQKDCCSLDCTKEMTEPKFILDESTGDMLPMTELNSSPVNDTTKVIETNYIVEEQILNDEVQMCDNEYDNFERQETEKKATDTQYTPGKKTETKEENADNERQSKEASQKDKLHLEPLNNKEESGNKITIISNESLQDYLKKKIIPDAPKRLGKRQADRMPFALTSDVYLEMVKAKQNKKQEAEAAKENRKRLREEKKKQKCDAPKKKRNTGKNKVQVGKKRIETITSSSQKDSEYQRMPLHNKMIVCCDLCLNPITKRVMQCSHCYKQFHVNCIPSLHRKHIPEDIDDLFLCHLCFHVSETDSSDGDLDDYNIYNTISKEARNQGF